MQILQCMTEHERKPVQLPAYQQGLALLTLKGPYNKVHGANMGPIWGRQDPGGPHVGPMNFAIWAFSKKLLAECLADAVETPTQNHPGKNFTQYILDDSILVLPSLPMNIP